MTHSDANGTAKTARDRLLEAARTCFLTDDYHKVGTRRIAEEAKVNVSMIRYYFGGKEGLFEEVVRTTFAPLLEALDGTMLESPAGFADYLGLYYAAMRRMPEFPRLILKVLALGQGPGRRFIRQLLERGRRRGGGRVEAMKRSGRIAAGIDVDVLRLSFVSLAMTPILLKDVFEEQMGRPMDEAFLHSLACLNGRMLAAALSPRSEDDP